VGVARACALERCSRERSLEKGAELLGREWAAEEEEEELLLEGWRRGAAVLRRQRERSWRMPL